MLCFRNELVIKLSLEPTLRTEVTPVNYLVTSIHTCTVACAPSCMHTYNKCKKKKIIAKHGGHTSPYCLLLAPLKLSPPTKSSSRFHVPVFSFVIAMYPCFLGPPSVPALYLHLHILSFFHCY